VVIDVAISRNRNIIKKEAEKILKYTLLTNTEQAECKNKNDKNNNKGNWYNFKIIVKIPEQRAGKA
jgi:hypothetical protein